VAGSQIPALTNAAYDALAADATLTALTGAAVKVFAAVPESTAPDYVIVRGGLEMLWGPAFDNEDGRSCEVVADITTDSKYRGDKHAADVASQAMTTLLDRSTWSGITGFQQVELVTNAPKVEQDLQGVVYYGRTVTVRVLVF
jgi:hypothetical protein